MAKQSIVYKELIKTTDISEVVVKQGTIEFHMFCAFCNLTITICLNITKCLLNYSILIFLRFKDMHLVNQS